MESDNDNKEEQKCQSEEKKAKRKYSKKKKKGCKKKWKNKKYFRRHFYDLYKEFKSIIHNLFCTQCNETTHVIDWEEKYPFLKNLWYSLPKTDLIIIKKYGIYIMYIDRSKVSVLCYSIYNSILEIPGLIQVELQFIIYLKSILQKINPNNFWSIVSIIRQAKYYYFSKCTERFNKEDSIWNINLNIVSKQICKLDEICLAYIKRFILIRYFYQDGKNSNEIFGLENETHCRWYLQYFYHFELNSYIHMLKKYYGHFNIT